MEQRYSHFSCKVQNDRCQNQRVYHSFFNSFNRDSIPRRSINNATRYHPVISRESLEDLRKTMPSIKNRRVQGSVIILNGRKRLLAGGWVGVSARQNEFSLLSIGVNPKIRRCNGRAMKNSNYSGTIMAPRCFHPSARLAIIAITTSQACSTLLHRAEFKSEDLYYNGGVA